MSENSDHSTSDNTPLMATAGKANASDDPFYAVRENTQIFIDKITVRHQKFQDLVFNVNTATNSEFKDLRKGLVKDVRTADRQVKELKTRAVDMAERNRDKFQHISDHELNQRKKFVDDMQRSIYEVKNAMESDRVRRKLEDDESKTRSTQNSESMGAINSREASNTNFVKDQRQQAQAMIGQQDVALGGLETAVDRLHVAGEAIGEELKLQNKMLNELDDDLDDAGNKMNFVQAKLSKLLKTKDGCQIWTIVGLAVVLLILTALVIFV